VRLPSHHRASPNCDRFRPLDRIKSPCLILHRPLPRASRSPPYLMSSPPSTFHSASACHILHPNPNPVAAYLSTARPPPPLPRRSPSRLPPSLSSPTPNTPFDPTVATRHCLLRAPSSPIVSCGLSWRRCRLLLRTIRGAPVPLHLSMARRTPPSPSPSCDATSCLHHGQCGRVGPKIGAAPVELVKLLLLLQNQVRMGE
jgi:hypothetical protein